jgi:hypothetical protein
LCAIPLPLSGSLLTRNERPGHGGEPIQSVSVEIG